MSPCSQRTFPLRGGAGFYLKTEGHYLAGQAVSSEEGLHGVGQLHLFGEHVPQQLIEEVAGVEQRHQHPCELILQIKEIRVHELPLHINISTDVSKQTGSAVCLY